MEVSVKTPKTKGFTTYQNDMADRIFELILEEDFKTLVELVKTIPTKQDYEKIHYAFYFKYDIGWLSMVEKFCGYDECKEYGFYDYDFK